MALKPFEEFIADPLEFPIGGKVYRLEPYDIPTGLKLTAIVAGQDEEFKSQPTVELYKLLLGSLWDQMLTDGVPLAAASRAGMTALADFQYNRTFAEAAWEKGEDPKAIAAYLVKNLPRAQRRSQSTGGANSTPRRASTKATTSRKR